MWNVGGKSPNVDYTGALYSNQLTSTYKTESGDTVGGGAAYIDASRSNPIYGNSNTVQPPAVRWSWCIQVYNDAVTLSMAQTGEIINKLTGYLPLAGGTMTGDIVFNGGNTIKLTNNHADLNLFSGTSWSKSSHIVIRGAGLPETDANYLARGEIILAASLGDEAVKRLLLRPNGEMKWCGYDISINSIGSNYIRYGNGIQMCWGFVEAGERTFPVAFVNTDYSIVISDTGSSPISWAAGAKKTTGFTAYANNTVNTHAQYIAIGKWK
jgi:hypothetical protein